MKAPHRADSSGEDRGSRPLPAPKSDFIGLAGKIHLATGGEPPLLEAHRRAFECFATDKAGGYTGYWRHWEVISQVREQIAHLIQLEPGDIALLGNASDGIMRVASSFDWQPGDNVVVPDLDYASGRFALASLKRKGVELRLVAAENWAISTESLLEACDQRTRLIYISQVNALTGQHADIAAMSTALRDTPTALLMDSSHALGVVHVPGDLADFTVSCCYKFALGIHEGILAWNRRRWPEFTPLGAGWVSASAGETPGDFRLNDDATRAEYGNVGHLGAYMLRESLDYLDQYGIDAIAGHVRQLSGRLVAGMAALGLDVMTPAETAGRAANAAFAHSQTGAIMRQAARDGVLIWGDNGRIRTSAHLFTTADDVDTFLDRLPGYLADS
jgi:cysteine desulfurase / selenocysteine lyase